MKNILSISILALCSSSINVSAQSDVAFFQVESNNYMQAQQLNPQTLVEYYSQNEGGVYQGTVQVLGNAFTASFPTVGAPKLFINRKTAANSTTYLRTDHTGGSFPQIHDKIWSYNELENRKIDLCKFLKASCKNATISSGSVHNIVTTMQNIISIPFPKGAH